MRPVPTRHALLASYETLLAAVSLGVAAWIAFLGGPAWVTAAAIVILLSHGGHFAITALRRLRRLHDATEPFPPSWWLKGAGYVAGSLLFVAAGVAGEVPLAWTLGAALPLFIGASYIRIARAARSASGERVC